ncbi:hypothetical protein BKH43_01130 [Helicobacter sp. 13S00401-1]|uniref:YceI family protein n=1 Tax=Helicobacter sp. 13S00401-1 TaxID=1905758 RepID=UPI000BA6100C|nr:YceI family protein [Helicobacter sp. 13S00401-1]PAF51867.1 hypothetical protein BKH43_01130 [Helicobacter sp. 13S00401-1]
MKKIVLALAAISAFGAMAMATTIDTSKFQSSFEGFKTVEKVGTSGTFKDAHYTFGKDSSSIKGQLTGAKATFNPMSVLMPAEPITNNMKHAFFETFQKKGKIEVVFEKVTVGDKQGTITAKVKMNGKSAIVPLKYELDDGKIEGKGVLDLNAFGLEKSVLSLTKAAAGHKGLTWPQVKIMFEAPLNN